MNLTLILLGLTVVLFLINVILIYRNRVAQAGHKAEIQKTVLEAVTATAEHRRRLDDDLAIVEEKHRVETITERAHVADRRDFDNDWGGLPIELTGSNATSGSATAADPAGSAGDQG